MRYGVTLHLSEIKFSGNLKAKNKGLARALNKFRLDVPRLRLTSAHGEQIVAGGAGYVTHFKGAKKYAHETGIAETDGFYVQDVSISSGQLRSSWHLGGGIPVKVKVAVYAEGVIYTDGTVGVYSDAWFLDAVFYPSEKVSYAYGAQDAPSNDEDEAQRVQRSSSRPTYHLNPAALQGTIHLVSEDGDWTGTIASFLEINDAEVVSDVTDWLAIAPPGSTEVFPGYQDGNFTVTLLTRDADAVPARLGGRTPIALLADTIGIKRRSRFQDWSLGGRSIALLADTIGIKRPKRAGTRHNPKSKAQETVRAYFDTRMDENTRWLIGMANWDLHYGPGIEADEGDGRTYPGFQAAINTLSEWADDNLTQVWVDTQSDDVQESAPEGYKDEDGEWVEPNYEDYTEFDEQAVKVAIFGALAGYLGGGGGHRAGTRQKAARASTRNLEFAVNDVQGYRHTFESFNEAAGFAVATAASNGGKVNLDVLAYTAAAAKAFGIEDYDPDDSVSQRIIIRADDQGRVP